MGKKSSQEGVLWTEGKDRNERLEITVRTKLRVLETKGRTKDLEIWLLEFMISEVMQRIGLG